MRARSSERERELAHARARELPPSSTLVSLTCAVSCRHNGVRESERKRERERDRERERERDRERYSSVEVNVCI